MNLLALIPARSGSKGIKGKNIKAFGGKPLIEWSILQALASSNVNRVVVSTDDPKIAEIASSAGADIPFMRPKSLATDESLVIDTVIHALNMIPDASDVLLLQPSSPLRRTSDIENMVNLRREMRCESVVSVARVTQHPSWMYKIRKNKIG